MFIGHFALAFFAKRVAPSVSLGTLFLTAQLADLLWPTFVLLGVEYFEIRAGATAVTPLAFISYPYSHSLLALSLWAITGALLYRAFGRRWGTAWTIAALVVSHWILDAVAHNPDMPLAFGTTRVGLGLWNSVPATIVIEGGLFALCVALYATTTVPRDRTGTVALWSLVIFLVVIYVANIFGPPPPSVAAVAWLAQAIWLLVAWGYWVDRHRGTRAA